MPKKLVVGVFGHYGNRNLGDEAIVSATIQQLRRRLDDVEIVCFSLRPNDTAFRHGVEAFSVRRLPAFPGPVRPTDTSTARELPWNTARESAAPAVSATAPRDGFKQRLKAVPILGRLAATAARVVSRIVTGAREVRVIVCSAAYLKR